MVENCMECKQRKECIVFKSILKVRDEGLQLLKIIPSICHTNIKIEERSVIYEYEDIFQ